MRFRKLYIVDPPESVATVELGEIFKWDTNNQLYIIVYRDAVRVLVRRWTLLDKVLVRVELAYLNTLRFILSLRGE